ncbi:MAG: ABC transporter permease [Anaerolineae bacterium]|nr:ABC transporter permease [Anaerolineae bacterium]
MSQTVIQSIFSAVFLATILRVATPILLPSLGALVSDRAGVINIGLEGTMLAAAFTGVVFSAYAQIWWGVETGRQIGPWLGLLMGVIVAVALALLLGFFHLQLKADLILAGIALNILGSAGTVAIMYELTGDRGNTSKLASLQVPFIQLPEFINQIPVIGPFFFQVFDNQSTLTWIAFIATGLLWFVMYRTSFGMHLRAVGENPAAAESVGIPVRRTRYMALILSGLFAGLGGVHMSMGYLTLFQRDMTSGRGFIALATPLLGSNHPVGTMLASLVFGFFDALSTRIGSLQIPSMLPQMIPYVATVMSLAIYALQTRQNQRVRALRAAEGEGFNASYWRIVQRLSLLHVLLMMIAVIGIIASISLFAAPNGFGGDAVAHPLGLIIAVVSIVLIVVNFPFLRRVENIAQRTLMSSGAATLSLGIYLGLFFSLFFDPAVSLIIGVVLGAAIWIVMGGVQLFRMVQTSPTPLTAT